MAASPLILLEPLRKMGVSVARERDVPALLCRFAESFGAWGSETDVVGAVVALSERALDRVPARFGSAEAADTL